MPRLFLSMTILLSTCSLITSPQIIDVSLISHSLEYNPYPLNKSKTHNEFVPEQIRFERHKHVMVRSIRNHIGTTRKVHDGTYDGKHHYITSDDNHRKKSQDEDHYEDNSSLDGVGGRDEDDDGEEVDNYNNYGYDERYGGQEKVINNKQKSTTLPKGNKRIFFNPVCHIETKMNSMNPNYTMSQFCCSKWGFALHHTCARYKTSTSGPSSNMVSTTELPPKNTNKGSMNENTSEIPDKMSSSTTKNPDTRPTTSGPNHRDLPDNQKSITTLRPIGGMSITSSRPNVPQSSEKPTIISKSRKPKSTINPNQTTHGPTIGNLTWNPTKKLLEFDGDPKEVTKDHDSPDSPDPRSTTNHPRERDDSIESSKTISWRLDNHIDFSPLDQSSTKEPDITTPQTPPINGSMNLTTEIRNLSRIPDTPARFWTSTRIPGIPDYSDQYDDFWNW